jgi:hypothetical protein
MKPCASQRRQNCLGLKVKLCTRAALQESTHKAQKCSFLAYAATQRIQFRKHWSTLPVVRLSEKRRAENRDYQISSFESQQLEQSLLLRVSFP